MSPPLTARVVPGTPTHSRHFRSTLAIVAAIGGALLALIGISLVNGFMAVDSNAIAYHGAPRCAGNRSGECVNSVQAVVTQHYLTHGSRGAITYYVEVYWDGPAQTTTVNSGDYDRLNARTVVTASIWRQTAVLLQPPDDGPPIATSTHPDNRLQAAIFGLLVAPIATALLAAALLLLKNPDTPDDAMRRAVAAQHLPPRPTPAGLRGAVLTWRLGIICIWAHLAGLVTLIVYALNVSSRVGLISTAPLVTWVLMAAVAAIAYRRIHRRAVRTVTLGALVEIPVTHESIIRGKGGPIGIKATYRLADGSSKKISITRRWWWRVHIATHLYTIADPESGKVWRLLGMVDDGGNVIY